MKIGLLLPSIMAAPRFSDRIFAPKPLFITLVNGLVARGHEVYVYSTSNLETRGTLVSGEKLLEERDLPSIRLRHKEPEFLERLIYKLTSYEYEIDLTARAYRHAQEEGVATMHSYHDFFAHYVAPLANIPTVYTLHDPPFAADTLEGWRIRRFAADSYVAVGRRQGELYQAAGVNVVGVVHHGLDVSQMPFLESAGGGMIFLGRFIAEKGIEDAITASEETGIALTLATSGNYLETPYYQTELSPRIAAAKTTVTVREFLRGEEKFAVMGSAKVLLFPVKWEEPFGLVMIEAMACGTPVIAFARGSVPEVVVDGVTGFIVEPEEETGGAEVVPLSGTPRATSRRTALPGWIIKKRGIEGLVEAVERIYAMPKAEYQAMRRACRAHVAENFTVDRMVDGYEAVYRKILGR